MKKFLFVFMAIFVAVLPVKQTQAQDLGSPRLMLTEYSVEVEELFAGDSTNLHLTIRNINAGRGASNIALTINSMDNSIIAEGINTTFIQNLPAWSETEWVVPIKVLETSGSGIHNLNLSMDYQDAFGGTYMAEAQIQVEVLPETRIAFNDIQYVEKIVHGENMEFSLNIMNLGKSSVSNVLLETQIPEVSEGVSILIGDLPAGSSQVGSLAFAMRDTVPAGDYEGQLVLYYEDELGESFSEEFLVNFSVEERLTLQTIPDEEDTEESVVQPVYLYIALGTVVILLLLLIIQSMRLRKLRAESNARL